ncbi:MAG: transcriptional repressor [Chlorobiaceae bacterium]|jgi:Fur family transcriptional regulator, ferric uptake regulator|nr:transcriptional repressor [Chlorobiaceae bacterium]
MRQPLEVIRNAGLKLTPRRREIALLFAETLKPLSPLEVQELLRKRFGRCGLPGVYRNLEALAECGLLLRLAGFGRERKYMFCPGQEKHHHHHIICVSCGKVGHVEGCLYHEGMMLGGYRVLSHIVQFEGLCENCLPKKP